MKKFSEKELKDLVDKAIQLMPHMEYDDPIEYKQLNATWYGPMAAEVFRVLVEQERGLSFVIR
jgi:hypothetical protein